MKVSRISVLNGNIYDDEYVYMLQEELQDLVKLIKPEWTQKFQNEIEIIPRYLFYKLALSKDRELPGHAFENCRMTRDEETGEPLTKKQKIGYFVIRILLVYLFKKMKKSIKDEKKWKYKVVNDENRLRWLDYEYLNRIVVWEEISKVLTMILPIFSSLGGVNFLRKIFLFTTLLGPLSLDLKSDDDKSMLSCTKCSAFPPNLPKILE